MGIAAPAHADAKESGYRGCNSTQVGRTHTYSSGTTWHYPPGDGSGKFVNGTTWKTTLKNGTARGCGDGFWSVNTDRSMNKSKTYADVRYAG